MDPVDRAALGEASDDEDDHPSVKAIVDMGQAALDKSEFSEAKTLFTTAQSLSKDNKHIIQQRVLATYKSKQPNELEALNEAKAIISDELDPGTSNDPETLGLWAAVHKRLWVLQQNEENLDQAINALERGFLLKRDYYNGINLAYMLNERACIEDTSEDEAIADRVWANRIRVKVMEYAKAELALDIDDKNSRYWILASLWEAAEGLGEPDLIEHWKQKAIIFAAEKELPGWMVESTNKQITKLRTML